MILHTIYRIVIAPQRSTWIELLNIEFYDYFIICLFLFYDRFYRSFAFLRLCLLLLFFLLFCYEIFTLVRLGTFLLLFFSRFVLVKIKNSSHTRRNPEGKEKNLCEMEQCNFNWCLFLYDFYQTNHKIRFSLFWIKACGKSIIKDFTSYIVVWFKRLCLRESVALHVWGGNNNNKSSNSGRNNNNSREQKETLTIPQHSRMLCTRYKIRYVCLIWSNEIKKISFNLRFDDLDC